MEHTTTPDRRRGPARRFTVVAAVVAVALVTLAACGDDGGATSATTGAAPSGGATTIVAAAAGDYYGGTPTIPPTTTPATTLAPSTTAAAASPALAVKVATTPLGAVLVDGAGRTLYVFTKDEKNKSNCTGGCLTLWPPLYGTPAAGTGVTAAKLGSFTTADGKSQATIDGMPLYYYSPDTAAGDVKGQNVGGVWFVVDGTGTIKK